jgi:rubrerythrin
MTVLTPTYETGATTKTSETVYAPPGRSVNDDALAAALPDSGLNTPFIADIMSSALTHERCGRHLYRSVAGRTNNPVLRAKYTSFGKETERHVEILEELITALGGDPSYVSPAARATEAADAAILQTTFMLSGSVDVMTSEMVMLEAVLLAEAIDHNNWRAIEALAGDLDDEALRRQFSDAVVEVLDDEVEHFEWAQTTRLEMIGMQSRHRLLTSATARAEEMLEKVKQWFS